MSPLVGVSPGAVTTVTLDNPPLNLVTQALTAALDDALGAVAGDPGVRCVIVTGAGDRAFCAGSDITEFAALRGRVGAGKLLRENAVYRRLARLPVPTIAAIQADALGGGLELALCCDLRIVDPEARLGLPEVRLGVIPGSGGTQRLPRLVGQAKAKEMILLGDLVDAAEAARIGLVSRVAPPGGAVAMAMELATQLAARGPVAVKEAKRAIDSAADVPLDEGLAVELDASERVFASDDMMEGASAFLEKRDPDFRNR